MNCINEIHETISAKELLGIIQKLLGLSHGV